MKNKVKLSARKIKNIAIGSFCFISSLMIVGGSVYIFIDKENKIEETQEMRDKAEQSCKTSGRLRSFSYTDRDDGNITFYAPNLRNTPYSTMSAMLATANACDGYQLSNKEGACIGPKCEENEGIGIPFQFTLEPEKGGLNG